MGQGTRSVPHAARATDGRSRGRLSSDGCPSACEALQKGSGIVRSVSARASRAAHGEGDERVGLVGDARFHPGQRGLGGLQQRRQAG